MSDHRQQLLLNPRDELPAVQEEEKVRTCMYVSSKLMYEESV